MVLSIKFKNGDNTTNEVEIKDAEYIPNIGESIYNSKDGAANYKVARKDCFFNVTGAHIVILATTK